MNNYYTRFGSPSVAQEVREREIKDLNSKGSNYSLSGLIPVGVALFYAGLYLFAINADKL